ncbi:MAG: PIN/TRAM domain-containing protein [Nitrospinota bacterium]
MVLLGAIAGYVIGATFVGGAVAAGTGAVIGVGVFGLVVAAEWGLSRYSARSIAGGFVGVLIGLLAAKLLEAPVGSLPIDSPRLLSAITLGLYVIGGYLGLLAGLGKGEEFTRRAAGTRGEREDRGRLENHKILDTSVIIDGRIADISETGFLEGIFVVPQFILNELQHIADSSDTLKRNRGRRGLDILQKIQKDPKLNVQILNKDFPPIREVDAKLVALAKELNGKIVTNDFNLNKVAELQGVTVLNINELANAMKPVVLPGEALNVFILKEGKEPGQGVAYLDDGTMVVVDNAKKNIGRNVEVIVTSVLQTTAGRMIFTRLKEDLERLAAS